MEITLVLHNVRSTYNVGAILRTAEGLGAKRLVYSGYTPSYNDPRLLPHLRAKLNRQIAKSALGAEEMVKQELVDDLGSWLEKKRAEGRILLGLENNLMSDEMSKRLVLGEKLPNLQRVVLVLGEEVSGIPEDLRGRLDYFLEIPMVGQKESFNVSIATAIALWGLLHPAI